jgi:hypothetical protein
MVLTYSTSGEPGRLGSARGLNYGFVSTWGTEVSQVQIDSLCLPRALGGSSCTS